MKKIFSAFVAILTMCLLFCVTVSAVEINGIDGTEITEEITELKATTVKVSNDVGGVSVKWNAVDNAREYSVYRTTGKSTEMVYSVQSGEALVYTDSNVKSGATYSYYVTAKNGDSESVSESISITYVQTPTVKSTSNGDGYVTVSWSKVSNAKYYRVYRRTEKSEWKGVKKADGSTFSCKDTTVENGVTYYYTVRADNGNTLSGYNKDGIAAEYVSTPGNLSLRNYNNKIIFTWGKVKGAVKYQVYRKDAQNTSWKRIAETKNNKYEDGNVKNGVKYTYTVRAVNGNNYRSYYKSGVTGLCLKMPSGFAVASRSGSGVTVYWNKASTATGYKVYRKSNVSDGWSQIANIANGNTTSYVDKTAKKGSTYIYTVKQMNGKTNGSYNINGIKIKHIAPPSLTVKHSPKKGHVLTWTENSSATGYTVQRKIQGESTWSDIKTVKGKSTVTCSDNKISYGKKHYYRVKVNGIANANSVSANIGVFGIDPNKPMVALTYDDGPYTPVTNKILDALEKNNGRATFFVVGSRVSAYSDCIKRANSLGCEIGNHTYNHKTLTGLSKSGIETEINKTDSAVKNVIGITPKIARAPGGAVNSSVKNYVKYPLFNWSVDTMDWKTRDKNSTVSAVKSNVKDGSIVLMHDLYESTGNASAEIIPYLVKNGYQLVTVSELMEMKGINATKGNLYCSGY
ncbi:MAG: polysaccharide deacetylase family protein [Acutalibacteraceae bacterium]